VELREFRTRCATTERDEQRGVDATSVADREAGTARAMHERRTNLEFTSRRVRVADVAGGILGSICRGGHALRTDAEMRGDALRTDERRHPDPVRRRPRQIARVLSTSLNFPLEHALALTRR
jgi:hypothetical protein